MMAFASFAVHLLRVDDGWSGANRREGRRGRRVSRLGFGFWVRVGEDE
jgi:hypothetical protein